MLTFKSLEERREELERRAHGAAVGLRRVYETLALARRDLAPVRSKVHNNTDIEGVLKDMLDIETALGLLAESEFNDEAARKGGLGTRHETALMSKAVRLGGAIRPLLFALKKLQYADSTACFGDMYEILGRLEWAERKIKTAEDIISVV
jgi:hypothetical protein